jgi:hypothetical protein
MEDDADAGMGCVIYMCWFVCCCATWSASSLGNDLCALMVWICSNS